MIRRLFVAFVAVAMSPAVHAEPSFTASVGVNAHQTDTYLGLFGGIDIEPLTLSRDHSGAGAQFTASARFGPLVGIEGGWADLGSTRGTAERILLCPGSCPPDEPPVIIDVKSRTSAYWLAYTPSITRGQWQLHASFGAARMKRELIVEGPWQSESTTELLLGAGATVALNDNIGVRFDLNRFGDVSTALGVSVAIRIR
ncbi:MAG: outer membrane beta-barrel protein [Gammaproteobacteria bacterium]